MIIRSSINCPTVKVFHRCYFYLREATSESYSPRGLVSIILLLILLSFCFCSKRFRSDPSFNSHQKTHLLFVFHLTGKGLTTPCSRWVRRFVFLCVGAEHVVVQGPPSGSIPWFLTEGSTSPLATSSSPLRGNHNVKHHHQATIKKYFWRRCRRGSFIIHQVPIYKSHLSTLTLFAICLRFSSPPLHHLPPVFLSPTSPFASRFPLSS